MTKQLDKTILAAVNTELNLASKDHGKHFNTPHEGYGVLMEEIWESGLHARTIDSLADNLLMYLHSVETCPDAYCSQLVKIKDQAMHGAAELIQVAAMCEKGLKSMRAQSERKE